MLELEHSKLFLCRIPDDTYSDNTDSVLRDYRSRFKPGWFVCLFGFRGPAVAPGTRRQITQLLSGVPSPRFLVFLTLIYVLLCLLDHLKRVQ